MSARFDFDWAIAPMTPNTFFETYFEKGHAVLHRADPDYYSGLLSVDQIDHAVSTLGLSHPEVNVVRADAQITTQDFCYDSGFVDAVRVNQLFADGATIIMANLQERLPILAQFCRALERVFSARIQTNIYLTPAHSQGFRAHYDSHDVLVLQIEGTKEWRIYDHPVQLPLDTQAFDPHDVPIGALTESFVLGPGDMAYIPRGLSHDAVATDQTSLHITTGLMTRTWADLVVEAVVAMAEVDPALRASLPPGHATDPDAAARLAPMFGELIDRVRQADLLPALVEDMQRDFIANRVPRAHGQMAQIANLPNLTPDSPVSVRPALIYRIGERVEDDGSRSIQLTSQGVDLSLPAHARETLEAALVADNMAIARLPGELDDDGKLILVRRLIREGLMTSA